MKYFIAVSAALVGGANAFWRMECPSRVGLARIDPIMNPGEMAPHVHAIHGSGGISETAGTPELLASDCTSCRVTQDKSSYWHPAPYFQDADTGEFEVVNQVGGMLAYYLLDGDNITAFPPDFRMISGDTKRRTYSGGDPSKPDPEKSLWASLGQTDQGTLAERALGFNCLNYEIDPEGTLYRHYLPEKSYLDAHCKNGIRFELMFPSCWKGGDETDSDNHQDHVAFPDLVMTGTCPDEYPVRIPSLLYEVIWDTYAFAGRNGRFVMANGDTTGYGYHGDFMMGWEEDLLQQAVDTCTNESGKIEDCAVFNVVDEATAAECSLNTPKALSSEDVKGPLKALPGDVEITLGDGSTEGGDEPSPTSATVAPTLTYKPGETPSDPAAPLPGQIFKESSSAYVAPAPTTTSASTSTVKPDVGALEIPETTEPAPVPTTTSAPPAVTPSPELEPVESESYISTQYVTDGNVVSKILWEEEVVYVTELEDATTTVVVPAPSAKRRRRGAHLHGHGHRHI